METEKEKEDVTVGIYLYTLQLSILNCKVILKQTTKMKMTLEFDYLTITIRH